MDASQDSLGSQIPGSQQAFVPPVEADNHDPNEAFVPHRPAGLKEAGLHQNDLYPLILKFLFLHGNRSGHQIAQQVKVPFPLVLPALDALKSDLLIIHKRSAGVGAYEYELSPKGKEQARIHLSRSTYCGAAPVSLAAYRQSIMRQSIRNLHPKFEDVARALNDLEVTDLLISQLGQALNSGKSMFLFGAPGNGKTSLAKRAISALSEHLWIPRAITIGGEVIRLYDPSVHIAEPIPASEGITNDQEIDERWIRIQRPTIVVGGELEMKHLEATLNPVTGIIEAPIHVKSNCGCLVVDDFGRQQISTTQLLNRWIVPMEYFYDYLNLPNGQQISIPFSLTLAFSTNFDPEKISDPAFLRRLGYKIQFGPLLEQEYRELWGIISKSKNLSLTEGCFETLFDLHRQHDVGFYPCLPKDIVGISRDIIVFEEVEPVISSEIVSRAWEVYFTADGKGGGAR